MNQGSDWDKDFNELWTGKDGAPPANKVIGSSIDNSIISSSDYFGLLRDHRLLYNLVRGNSIRFITKVGQEEAIIEPQDISWAISQFKYVRRISNGGGTGFTPVVYYRYSIRADAKTRSFTVPVPDADIEAKNAKIEVPITVEAEWTNPEGGISLADERLFFVDPPPLSVPTNTAIDSGSEDQEAFKERANYFSGILQYAAGSSLGEVVSRGLFGGGTNTSLFAGAMISKKDVSQMAGVNFELNPNADTRAGVLLGFDVSNSNTLFLGPSISHGPVQLSVGARVSSKDNDSNGNVSTRLAGALAVDLSRTLGKREKKVSLTLDSSKTGGDWGQASDEQFKNLELVTLTFDISAVPPGLYKVQLKRVEEFDANFMRVKVPAEKQDAYTIPVSQQLGLSKRMFMPLGLYEVAVSPAGFKYDGTQNLRVAKGGGEPYEIKIIAATP